MSTAHDEEHDAHNTGVTPRNTADEQSFWADDPPAAAGTAAVDPLHEDPAAGPPGTPLYADDPEWDAPAHEEPTATDAEPGKKKTKGLILIGGIVTGMVALGGGGLAFKAHVAQQAQERRAEAMESYQHARERAQERSQRQAQMQRPGQPQGQPQSEQPRPPQAQMAPPPAPAQQPAQQQYAPPAPQSMQAAGPPPMPPGAVQAATPAAAMASATQSPALSAALGPRPALQGQPEGGNVVNGQGMEPPSPVATPQGAQGAAAVEGVACPTNGLVAQNGAGHFVSCQPGSSGGLVWTAQRNATPAAPPVPAQALDTQQKLETLAQATLKVKSLTDALSAAQLQTQAQLDKDGQRIAALEVLVEQLQNKVDSEEIKDKPKEKPTHVAPAKSAARSEPRKPAVKAAAKSRPEHTAARAPHHWAGGGRSPHGPEQGEGGSAGARGAAPSQGISDFRVVATYPSTVQPGMQPQKAWVTNGHQLNEVTVGSTLNGAKVTRIEGTTVYTTAGTISGVR